MSDNITYREILNRAKDAAKDACPELPKSNTYDAWEAFAAELEAFKEESHSIACEQAESWDWCIYYWQSMQVCMAVDSPTLHSAESQVYEMGTFRDSDESQFGLFELAAQIAFWICQAEIDSAIYTLADELLELAQNEMENAV